MAEKKRKNKSGAGRPATGRTHRIYTRVSPAVGQQMDRAAETEGMGPLIERLWKMRVCGNATE